MEFFALVHPGLEQVAQQEIKELIGKPGIISPSVIEFSVNKKEECVPLLSRVQSLRRLLFSLGKYKSTKNIAFKNLDFPWKEILPHRFSFRVTVENIPGNERRIQLATTIANAFYKTIEKEHQPTINLTHPDLQLIVFYNNKEYFVGIDGYNGELSSREYRIFTHAASMKGDLGYHFVRLSGFAPGERLLVGSAKDGTIAIEAAFYIYHLPVRKNTPIFFSLLSSSPASSRSTKNPAIVAVDHLKSSIIAAKKNASLAKVTKLVQWLHLPVGELASHLKSSSFDRAIFYISGKEEDQLHEILSQSHALLKRKGTLLIVTRKNISIGSSDRFTVQHHLTLTRGDSPYFLWLLQK